MPLLALARALPPPATIAVAAVTVTAGGSLYSTAPSVSIVDSGGTGVGATAFSLMSVTGVSLVLAGNRLYLSTNCHDL